jgi:uncharacterized protein (TIGR03086 family)
MSQGRPAAVPPTSGVVLLERAVAYTLGNLQLVTPEALWRPTPCQGWNLRALLHHMEDSLAALQEAVDLAHVTVPPPGADQPPPRSPTVFAALGVGDPGPVETAGDSGVAGAVELVARLRDRACHLLGSWLGEDRREPISIGGRTLPASVLTSTGAIEIAVHGWDVARACGRRRPIPPRLAQELLVLASLLVRRADRPARFAPPVRPAPQATPSDHLLAFLGRHPD